MQTMMMTKGYGVYGSARHGTGAYQAAATQPRVFQNVRLMDELLRHVHQAHLADSAGNQAQEYLDVEGATMLLRGLNAMVDKRQGRVAQNLEKTYRSLIVALHGVCSMVNTQGQYVRLYGSILELRNAWASVSGISFTSAPGDMSGLTPATGLNSVSTEDLLGIPNADG